MWPYVEIYNNAFDQVAKEWLLLGRYVSFYRPVPNWQDIQEMIKVTTSLTICSTTDSFSRHPWGQFIYYNRQFLKDLDMVSGVHHKWKTFYARKMYKTYNRGEVFQICNYLKTAYDQMNVFLSTWLLFKFYFTNLI